MTRTEWQTSRRIADEIVVVKGLIATDPTVEIFIQT